MSDMFWTVVMLGIFCHGMLVGIIINKKTKNKLNLYPTKQEWDALQVANTPYKKKVVYR